MIKGLCRGESGRKHRLVTACQGRWREARVLVGIIVNLI